MGGTMSRTPRPAFFNDFDAACRNSCIELLSEMYDAAAESAAAAEWSNENTFGTEVYNFTKEASLSLSAKGELPFVAYMWRGALRWRVGDIVCAPYRVGKSAQDRIEESFPNSNNSAGRIVSEYLPGYEPSIENARAMVVAHLGNRHEGLCAIYLCVPPRLEGGGQINEWLYWEKIFLKGGEESGSVPVTPSVGSPPPEESVETVQPKRRRDVGEGEGS